MSGKDNIFLTYSSLTLPDSRAILKLLLSNFLSKAGGIMEVVIAAKEGPKGKSPLENMLNKSIMPTDSWGDSIPPLTLIISKNQPSKS